MRVFVLCTGRCGSLSVARAFRHATNYTAAHESGRRNHYTMTYPEDHIEVDNRLAWFLGRLSERYGNDPQEIHWVHLKRDPMACAKSFEKRGEGGILNAYRNGIKQGACDCVPHEARDLIRTVNANIREFLKGRPHSSIFIERAHEEFPPIWNTIGAAGDLEAALAEFDTRHNAS